jgi:DNA-binding winged helix-turn-helix (wHTH) protein
MSGHHDAPLGPRERAVLGVLVEQQGRVIDRSTLRRGAGLDDLSPRRCESVLVRVRRVLGPEAIVTVRRRGWRLSPEGVAAAAAIVADAR